MSAVLNLWEGTGEHEPKIRYDGHHLQLASNRQTGDVTFVFQRSPLSRSRFSDTNGCERLTRSRTIPRALLTSCTSNS